MIDDVEIVARAAFENIGTFAAIERIVAAASVERIVIEAAQKSILALAAEENIVPGTSLQMVISQHAEEDVGPSAAEHGVVAEIRALEHFDVRVGVALGIATAGRSGFPVDEDRCRRVLVCDDVEIAAAV